jgi:hypothetical protein
VSLADALADGAVEIAASVRRKPAARGRDEADVQPTAAMVARHATHVKRRIPK